MVFSLIVPLKLHSLAGCGEIGQWQQYFASADFLATKAALLAGMSLSVGLA